MRGIDVKEILHDAVTAGNTLIIVDKEHGSINFYPNTVPRLLEAIAHWSKGNWEIGERRRKNASPLP